MHTAHRRSVLPLAFVTLSVTVVGCSRQKAPPPAARPSVAPTSQPSASLDLAGAEMRPMYRELLPVDLPTVARVAMARSIDVKQARERVAAAKGRYESSVEAVFPIIAPALTYQHFDG